MTDREIYTVRDIIIKDYENERPFRSAYTHNGRDGVLALVCYGAGLVGPEVRKATEGISARDAGRLANSIAGYMINN